MSYEIEAVLLTGGASRRMGQDKSKMLVMGEPLGERIARLLAWAGYSVTVCGREPIPGHAFLADAEEFAGPLVALSRFKPTQEFVFVISCDVRGFDPRIVGRLADEIGGNDAVIPSRDDRLQPLCALYRSTAFDLLLELVASGERRIFGWVDRLAVRQVDTLPREWLLNWNTPEDLES